MIVQAVEGNRADHDGILPAGDAVLMVALDMGVTILSNMVYRPWSLEGQHVEVRPVTDHVPTMDVGLAWRRNTETSPPVRVFYEYLDRTFRGSGHGFVNADVSARNA